MKEGLKKKTANSSTRSKRMKLFATTATQTGDFFSRTSERSVLAEYECRHSQVPDMIHRSGCDKDNFMSNSNFF